MNSTLINVTISTTLFVILNETLLDNDILDSIYNPDRHASRSPIISLEIPYKHLRRLLLTQHLMQQYELTALLGIRSISNWIQLRNKFIITESTLVYI